jgi:NADH:ubiquinone reductase (H+-translocating)
MSRPRVVIVGGGFGGLTAAKSLRNSKVEIKLVDKTNHHLFQPLLYQVAMGGLSPADIAVPLRSILRNQANLDIVMDEVKGVNRETRLVELASGASLPYDYLILAPGTGPSYFGNDNWAQLAPGLKNLTDAMQIREHMLMSFENAARLRTVEERQQYLTFVVVGAGPTGVETSGAIAEIGRKTMAFDYRLQYKDEVKVYLIEASDRILSSYDPALSEAALQDLRKIGVQVLLNTRVEEVTADQVVASGRTINTVNVIWAAGNEASPVLRSLDTELDWNGRAIVRPDCSLPDDPTVFVIGDAAHFAVGEEGNTLPGVAQTAIQQAKYVAKIIAEQRSPDWRKPFVYTDLGSMATIGRAKAIVQVGKLHFTGFLAWLMWCFLHVAYLIGFRNRLRVMLEWIWFYFTFQPGARVIYWRAGSKVFDQIGEPAKKLPTP